MHVDFLHLESDAEFVPATHIARQVGYTPDYISKLARDGRIASRKIGKKWFVQPASLFAFLEEVEIQKLLRSRELSEVRQRELIASQRSLERQNRILYAIHSTRYIAFAQTVLLGLVGILIPTLFIFAPANYQASVHVAGNSFFEYLAISVYEIFTPTEYWTIEKHLPNESDRNDGADESSVVAGDGDSESSAVSARREKYIVPEKHGDTLVFPDSVPHAERRSILEASFSDEVKVVFDDASRSSGVIIPEFRSGSGLLHPFVITASENPSS